MRVDLALLGDYALADKMDKLTVAGIFRAIAGTRFPFRRSVMYLALMLTAEAGEDEHHTIMVRMIDPDGRDLMPELRTDLDVHRQEPEIETSLNIILELEGVTFQGPGTHCFDIFIDNRFMERVPLEVILVNLIDAGPSAGQ